MHFRESVGESGGMKMPREAASEGPTGVKRDIKMSREAMGKRLLRAAAKYVPRE